MHIMCLGKTLHYLDVDSLLDIPPTCLCMHVPRHQTWHSFWQQLWLTLLLNFWGGQASTHANELFNRADKPIQ